MELNLEFSLQKILLDLGLDCLFLATSQDSRQGHFGHHTSLAASHYRASTEAIRSVWATLYCYSLNALLSTNFTAEGQQ